MITRRVSGVRGGDREAAMHRGAVGQEEWADNDGNAGHVLVPPLGDERVFVGPLPQRRGGVALSGRDMENDPQSARLAVVSAVHLARAAPPVVQPAGTPRR